MAKQQLKTVTFLLNLLLTTCWLWTWSPLKWESSAKITNWQQRWPTFKHNRGRLIRHTCWNIACEMKSCTLFLPFLSGSWKTVHQVVIIISLNSFHLPQTHTHVVEHEHIECATARCSAVLGDLLDPLRQCTSEVVWCKFSATRRLRAQGERVRMNKWSP